MDRTRGTRPGRGLLLAALMLAPAAAAQRPLPRDTDHVKLFRLRSAVLSRFWKRDMYVEAGVVLPPRPRRGEKLPVCYAIHGFGGSHRVAWRRGPSLVRRMTKGYPRMLYVYLHGQFWLGHHEFADSANNGPWGTALTTEFIPALEKKFGAYGRPEGRFLTGHSSGGWSSLWLQITHPDFFGGTWSTAPDPVDFRDFTGVNIYEDENAFYDARGNEIPLIRRGPRWVMTLKQFCEREQQRSGEEGGQMASFDAVFSPRGANGRPRRLFDRTTGVLDRAVAKAWQKYDIRLILHRRWKTLGPRLQGKIHVYVGTLDTFRLEGAVKLLQKELKALGSDAEIRLVEGRDHMNLFRRHPRLWPRGLMEHIHRAMRAAFRKNRAKKHV